MLNWPGQRIPVTFGVKLGPPRSGGCDDFGGFISENQRELQNGDNGCREQSLLQHAPFCF